MNVWREHLRGVWWLCARWVSRSISRVQHHRSQRPQKRLWWRRAAASAGVACKVRRRSPWSRSRWFRNLCRGGIRQTSHTLFGRNAQVVYDFQVQEEAEGVWQELRKSKKGEQGREKRLHEYGHVDGVKFHELSHGACARDDAQTRKIHSALTLRQCGSLWKWSGHVVIGVRIVQCHNAIMDNFEHVVIGVRVMQCHHIFIFNVHFWSQFHIVTCSQFQLVVTLYELIVTFHPLAILCTFAPRKHVK